MKPTNDTLNAILASRQFLTADLYQFTLSNGSVLTYAQAQVDIVLLPSLTVYPSGKQTGPYFDRSDNKAKVAWKLGTGNDQLVIDVIPGSATIGNLSFLDAVRCGIFDAADLQLSRAFIALGTNPTSPLVVQPGCAVLMFQGRVAEVDADRSIATFTINDYRELLSQQLPRNLFAASCANSFGDASCTVIVANFSENGVVQTGTTQSAISTTLVRASDYYDMGKITFTSGKLNGLSFGVSTWTQGSPGTVVPYNALPHVPAVGDTFTIAPGCDKTFSGGCTKYSNTANFRGEPYTPAPETAL